LDGFTPTFFLELIIALLSAGGVYGAIRMDLKTLRERVDEERRQREAHAKEDDDCFRELRDDLGGIHGRLSVVEARIGVFKNNGGQ